MTPGEINYQAYRTYRNGKTFDGREAPTWEKLGYDIQQAWEAGAKGVIADYVKSREDSVLTTGLPEPMETMDDEGTSEDNPSGL